MGKFSCVIFISMIICAFSPRVTLGRAFGGSYNVDAVDLLRSKRQTDLSIPHQQGDLIGAQVTHNFGSKSQHRVSGFAGLSTRGNYGGSAAYNYNNNGVSASLHGSDSKYGGHSVGGSFGKNLGNGWSGSVSGSRHEFGGDTVGAGVSKNLGNGWSAGVQGSRNEFSGNSYGAGISKSFKNGGSFNLGGSHSRAGGSSVSATLNFPFRR